MSFVRSLFTPALRLSRQPRPIYRTLATQVPVPPAAQQASSSASTLQEGSESVAPIFEEGDVDVTDSVLRMLESEGGFPSNEDFSPISYLPLSSLKSDNPALPSSDELAIPLAPDVFAQPLRKDILHRCSVWYLANLRQGSGSTKTRADVNYSGRKLYRQKGTGKARAGSAGSGTRRGGGTIHGPHPRSFAQLLPRKVRQLGLHVALSSKLTSGLLRVVNEMGETSWEGKTRLAVKALCDDKPTNENEFESLYEVDGAVPENTPQERQIRFGHPEKLSILFVAGPPTTESEFEGLITTARTVNNIPGVEVIPIEELQAYEVLKRKWVVLDVKAVEWLTARSKDNDLFEEDEGEEIDVADMTEAEVESRPAA